VEEVFGLTSTITITHGGSGHLDGALVAVQESPSHDRFLIHATDNALERVKTALAHDGASLYEACGWPQLAVNQDSVDEVKLIVDNELRGDLIRFLYPESSFIHTLGLQRLLPSIPRDPAHPARCATRVRDFLRAGAHFFKYLGCKPTEDNRLPIENYVQVNLRELVEGKGFVVVNSRIQRPLVSGALVDRDPTSKAYKIKALAAGERVNQMASLYSVEILNTLDEDMFVWVFLFDCSTFEISKWLSRSYMLVLSINYGLSGTLYQPSIPSRLTSSSAASVPGTKEGADPQPVLLNTSDSGHVPLTFKLYDGQSIDVSFLQIFILRKYSDLSMISQDSPMEVFKPKAEHGERTVDEMNGRSAPEAIEEGLWAVITLPLVQRTHWDK
jgi:hypothetical protein